MITLRNIVKSFDEQVVLKDVSLDVEKQTIFGLLGPSGAGKTTLINIMTNQLTCDSGYHQIDAKPLEIGLMLDQDGLYSRLSCQENLNLFAGIYGVSPSKVATVLQQVGLEKEAKKAVNNLSKGMRQRLALARAIIHEPKVLFLDEPTSGLDPYTARGIQHLILDLKQRGSTVFLTSHNMEEVGELCDYVALLHHGTIVEQGTPLEICQRYNAFKTINDLASVFIKLTGVELNASY